LAAETAMDSGYATITVQAGSGVFAFASVVDNLTNDPTTVLGTSSGDFVPVASHTSGLNRSEWRTDLAILNPNAFATDVTAFFYGADGIVSETFPVPAGGQMVLKDVVGQLGANGSGALTVALSSGGRVEMTSRTYSEFPSNAACFPGGTQGQDYPVLLPENGLLVGQTAYLPGLVEDSTFRSNIGLVNLSAFEAATVLVELYDGTGTRLADYTVVLQVDQWSQAVQPFRKLAGQTAMDSGYAKITVQAGVEVFAFASIVDNLTNDPTTVTMQR
jgi:hypothetical protein